METTTQEKPQTGLIKVEEITGIMTGAGEVLIKNEKLVNAAASKGQTYLDTIEGNGMSDEIDAELNAWQIKAKQALEMMNSRRSPITQMMTQIARVFTGLEAKIDPAKPDSVYTKIQNHRNAYAKQKATEQQQKQQAILKQQNIDKEKISLKAEVESKLRLAYQNKLLEFKSFYSKLLNEATLETFDTVSAKLKTYKASYPHDKYLTLAVNVTAIYLDATTLAGLIFDTRESLYNELSANFVENMEAHVQSLKDQLPSKKAELDRIEKAGKEEKLRLQKEADERAKNDQAALLEQSNKAKEQDTANVELQKQIEVTGNLFSTSAALAEVKSNTGPVRQGFTINVTSPAGWGAIFLFWFEKEGQKMNAKDMGKKTLDQMKSFCEKHAHKTGSAHQNAVPEKVVHAHVVYEEDFKAIATKEK